MNLDTGTIIDRYEVLGELGQGGMASVHTVRHTRLGSIHVLKVLTVQGRAVRERLLLEGQVQARLKHPNVVEVTDVIDVNGSPGLVMEYIAGPSLDALLANGPLPLELVRKLVPGICAGIAAAHAEGVVHRDLKPANILLSLKRGMVVPKIADFGLVKQLADDPASARTRTGAAMGTPQYMAPEQIDNAKDVDARADIWALGAILYELVSGHRAFDGETHYQIFQSVVNREFTPLSDRIPGLPPSVLLAVEAAMQPYEQRTAHIEAIWRAWEPEIPLQHAATTASEWPVDVLDTLARLTPDTLATPSRPEASLDTYVPSESVPDGVLAAEAPSSPPMATAVTLPPSNAPLWVLAVGLPVSVLLVAGMLGALTLLVLVGRGVDQMPPPVQLSVIDKRTTTAKSPDSVDMGDAPIPEPTSLPEPSPVPDPATTPPPVPEAPASSTPGAPPPTSAAEHVAPVSPDPTPRPDPAPANDAMGTFALGGTTKLPPGVRVYLKSGKDTHPPGPVPVGTYTLVLHDDRGPANQGTVTIVAGQTAIRVCKPDIRHCGVK